MPKIAVCQTCQETRLGWVSRLTGLFQCRNCGDRNRYLNESYQKFCTLCGNSSRITSLINGKLMCQSCYRKYFRPRQVCEGCMRILPVSFSKRFGKKLCSTCLSRHRMTDTSKFEICFICSNNKPVCTRYNGKPVCYTCYPYLKN